MAGYTRESLSQKVMEIIVENLESGPSEISLSSDLINDLHADSLDVLNIVLAVEKELDVTLDDVQVADCRTPDQIVSLLWPQLPHSAVKTELSVCTQAQA